MGFNLKNFLGINVDKVIDSVGKVIDDVITTKEEKEILKQQFAKILQDHEYRIQGELTKRHQIDMVSDSKLSKLIRPMTLIYLLILLTGLVTVDSIGTIDFEIAEAWVKLLTILTTFAFSFYFGGRELQKWLINRKI